MNNKKLLTGSVAQAQNSGTFRGMARKAVSKLKQVPAVDKASSLLNQAKHNWKMRAAAAALSIPLLCGTITGCGTDNPFTSSGGLGDLQNMGVVYRDASGKLDYGRVRSDHGDTLIVSTIDGGMELHESEVLGVSGGSRPDYILFPAGNHLNNYGDVFADFEYINGIVNSAYELNGKTTYFMVGAQLGVTSTGKRVHFYEDLGYELEQLLIPANTPYEEKKLW